MLKEYEQAIMMVRHNPEVGTFKTGDLVGIYGYDISYLKTHVGC